jgi:diaminopimelate epimerase
VVETDAGPRHCDVVVDGRVGVVTTTMGVGSLQGTCEAELAGEHLVFQRVSMGNPHAIIFRAPIDAAVLDQLGPAVSASFAEGTNVEIATLEGPERIRVDVWERGVGRTLACGTGAAATVVAAVQAGLSPHDRPVTVKLPGGPLEITVSRELDVTLTGPARWVFSGRTES